MKQIYKTILSVILIVITVLFITFCVWKSVQLKELIKTDSIQVIQKQNEIFITDMITNQQYNYRTVRIKKNNNNFKQHNTISTESLKIDILESGELKITDNRKGIIYIINHTQCNNVIIDTSYKK